MTPAEFGTYLLFVVAFSGALGVVNLLRPAKRWLGAGSILVGVAALLYRQTGSTTAPVVVGVFAALCMVVDVSKRRSA